MRKLGFSTQLIMQLKEFRFIIQKNLQLFLYIHVLEPQRSSLVTTLLDRREGVGSNPGDYY